MGSTNCCKRDDFENAVRCYEKSLELLPDYDTIHALAGLYEEHEDFDKVVPTLQRYLEVEEYGLGHSNTNAAIAQFLMRREKFEEAKPYAIEAAQSWSGLGLGVAARACEWAGDMEGADEWFAELSRAYPSYSGLEWWLFRRRAGLPKKRAAKELAETQLGDEEHRKQESCGWWPLAFYLLDDRDEKALEFARLRAQQESSVYSESHLLSIAARLDEGVLYRAGLSRLVRLTDAGNEETQTWSARYARALRAIKNAKSANDLPLEEMDALLENHDAAIGWCDAAYFFGKLLNIEGHEAPGERYLQRAADFRDQERVTWHLAVAEKR